MALHFLRLPSSPHSHLSPSELHSPIRPSTSLSPSSSSLFPQSYNHPNTRSQTILKLLHHQHFTPLTTQTRARSSPAAETAAAENEQEAKEPVVIFDRRRLIAQNIPWSCTADDIRALFEKHGTVLDVQLSMYNSTRNRGLAFITMATEEEATHAIDKLNSCDLNGRAIKVEFSTSLKKNLPVETQVREEKYTVYVGNLVWGARSTDLRELFKATGRVVSAEVIYQSKPRRPAGYGFVSFASKEEAETAISTLNGKGFMGRPLRLGFSKLQVNDIEGLNDAEEAGGESSKVNADQETSNQADEI